MLDKNTTDTITWLTRRMLEHYPYSETLMYREEREAAHALIADGALLVDDDGQMDWSEEYWLSVVGPALRDSRRRA